MGPIAPKAPKRVARANLLRDPRFEIMPLTGVLDQIGELGSEATVTVTSSPSKGTEATLDLAVALAERGVRAVPHLAARQLHDETELSEILDRLDRAGIRDAFVVGGDAEEPAGQFPDGLSLLKSMDSLGHGLEHIGVPSYPDGHHRIDDDTAMTALHSKQHYATYTVTQMCFDASAIARFTRAAREQGVTLPIYAGIPGVVDLAKLLRISFRIGVGDSVRFARGNRSVVTRLLRPQGYRPDGLVRKLGSELHAGRADLAGLHIYTFNHLDATARWMQTAHRRVAIRD